VSETVDGMAKSPEPLLREIQPASMLGAKHSHNGRNAAVAWKPHPLDNLSGRRGVAIAVGRSHLSPPAFGARQVILLERDHAGKIAGVGHTLSVGRLLDVAESSCRRTSSYLALIAASESSWRVRSQPV